MLKIWQNSLMKDWKLVFFALYDDFLIMKDIEELIIFDEKANYFKNVKFYDIRRVNWIDSRSQ